MQEGHGKAFILNVSSNSFSASVKFSSDSSAYWSVLERANFSSDTSTFCLFSARLNFSSDICSLMYSKCPRSRLQRHLPRVGMGWGVVVWGWAASSTNVNEKKCHCALHLLKWPNKAAICSFPQFRGYHEIKYSISRISWYLNIMNIARSTWTGL